MAATTIPIWREGILYVNKKPMYIVRQTDFPGGESAVGVYAVSEKDYKASKGTVIKPDWQLKERTSQFNGASVLSDIAKRKEKLDLVKVEKPALYTSRVVNGIGTFGGKEGLGFFEYTQEKYNQVTREYEPGQPTGVFILLDDIRWEDKIHMDDKSLLQLLTETNTMKQEGLYRL